MKPPPGASSVGQWTWFSRPVLIPMYRSDMTLREHPKGAGTWNRLAGLQRKGNRIDLPIDDVHEVIAIRY